MRCVILCQLCCVVSCRVCMCVSVYTHVHTDMFTTKDMFATKDNTPSCDLLHIKRTTKIAREGGKMGYNHFGFSL